MTLPPAMLEVTIAPDYLAANSDANRSEFGNVIYRSRSNFLLSAKSRTFRTFTIQGTDQRANQLNLNIGGAFLTDKWYKPLRYIFTGFLLLYSVLAPAPATTADEQGEIARLAKLMQWKAGTVVADIGAGNGQYSFVAAGIVGPSGRVYATEIDQQKLKSLREEVARRKLDNVIIIESAADDTKLPSNCCDVIFLRRVYHHLIDPRDFDKNLIRSLKVWGQLAIIDFPPDPNLAPVEGVPKNRAGHGVAENATVEELTSAGLHVEKKIDNWSNRDYCVIFSKIDQ